jgi:ribonuclease R
MKRRARRAEDPHLAREQGRYGHALPSRELILEVLTEAGVPLDRDDLERRLDIEEAERELFARRIAAMERDGQLLVNRRGAVCIAEKLDLVRGEVTGHKDGYGFLRPDGGGAELYLAPKQMQLVLHGDRVLAREIASQRPGRREAVIVEVLERSRRRVVGRLHVEHGVRYVIAEDRRISQEILIEPGDRTRAELGAVVVAEIVEPPARNRQPIGRIVEVLGNYADPGMEIEIALRKHDLPHVFPPDAERLAARLPEAPRRSDLRGREDLRELPLLTIDGADARDFDDAVYCEPLATAGAQPARARRKPAAGEAPRAAFRLIVAIADVSHYVAAGDALDQEARARATSVYFPRRVIPMLPERLSNGLCSLNPGVDRLCVACEMRVGADGSMLGFRFFDALMRSRARLTYDEVAELLSGSPARHARNYRDLVPHLDALAAVYRALLAARERRGAIDFESVETRMLFDREGKIERIVPVERNDAHRLIEECMLAANVCASQFLAARSHPMLYRVHAGPSADRLETLREFLRGFGLALGGADSPHARDYAAVLDQIRDRPDRRLIQTVMLRSLAQAVYSPDNIGHFGLAYDGYTHFTSPIRRYPDLLVHRAIKAVIAGRRYEPVDWAGGGRRPASARRPPPAPTRPRATSRPGSSATTCASASARCSAARSAASPRSACSSPWTICTSTG